MVCNLQGSFSDKPGPHPTPVRFPRRSGQPISDSPEMGERATGGGLGAAAMSVREALFSRRMVPRSLNRSPGPERRGTVLTWASEGSFKGAPIFAGRRPEKIACPRGLPRPPNRSAGSTVAAFGFARPAGAQNYPWEAFEAVRVPFRLAPALTGRALRAIKDPLPAAAGRPLQEGGSERGATQPHCPRKAAAPD